MKKVLLTLLVGTVIMLWPNAVAYSATEDTAVEGKIVLVSPNVITLDTSEAVHSEYISLEINDKTKLEAMIALSELKRGDQVKIQYVEKDGKKIAANIAKIEPMAARQNTRS